VRWQITIWLTPGPLIWAGRIDSEEPHAGLEQILRAVPCQVGVVGVVAHRVMPVGGVPCVKEDSVAMSNRHTSISDCARTDRSIFRLTHIQHHNRSAQFLNCELLDGPTLWNKMTRGVYMCTDVAIQSHLSDLTRNDAATGRNFKHNGSQLNWSLVRTLGHLFRNDRSQACPTHAIHLTFDAVKETRSRGLTPPTVPLMPRP
jgi:hypothetical protein